MRKNRIKDKLIAGLVILALLLSPLFFYLGYQISSKIYSLYPGIRNQTTVGTFFLTPTPTLTPEQFKQALRIEINQYRATNGLKPLKENNLLGKSAELKLQDLIQNNYWAHTSPDGLEPWNFFLISGYKYQYAGENLARDFSYPLDVFTAWLVSPGHKENIVADRFIEDGMAVSYFERGQVMVVHHFGSPLIEAQPAATYDPNAPKEVSRSGRIVPYHEWCTDKDISVYENELITRKSSDGKTYSMTQGDWDCYESVMKNE